MSATIASTTMRSPFASPNPSKASTSMLPTPPRGNAQHRLLYRGALALPDSNLQLDGIAFTAKIPQQSPNALFDSPIPLALESMRGLPLSLIGVIPLQDVKLDWDNEIHVFLNPDSWLTLDFVERNLCFEPIGETNRTDWGLRIGVGDSFTSQDDDIIVYGRLSADGGDDSDKAAHPTLHLVATRFAPASPPKPTAPRIPRPDDPSPRRPDVFAQLLLQNNAKRGHKQSRPRDTDQDDERIAKRPKLNSQPSRTTDLLRNPPPFPKLTSAGSSKHDGTGKDTDGFRVPVLPAKSKSSGDVRKKSTEDQGEKEMESSPLETNNKTTIKAATVSHLRAIGYGKDHPEFKELYQWCIRGVGFALRRQIGQRTVSIDHVADLVAKHLEMYTDGPATRERA